MKRKSLMIAGAVIAPMFALIFIHTGRGPMLGVLDIAMFRAINHGLQNPMLNSLAEVAYSIGSSDKKLYMYLFLLTALILLISIIRSSRELKRLAMILAIALLISAIITYPLKSIYGISRPYSYLDSVYIYKGKNWLNPKEPPSQGDKRNSFPSGHATVTFTVLGALWAYRRTRVVLFISLVLMSFLIVYVGSHYVSDIVVGAAAGFAVGYLVQNLTLTAFPYL